LQFAITTSGVQGGFPPKEAEQGIALLREFSESLVAPAGTLTGDHADVTGDSFPVGEASWITEEDFSGERSDRANAGMSHESARVWSLLSLLLDLMIETVDEMLKLWVQRKQAIALSSGIWGQRQGAESVLASWGPKGAAATQTVTQGQRLQAELHASLDAYELMPVSQENLQVALLAGGHPDRGKAFFRQQREDQASRRSFFCLRGSAARIFAGWPTRQSISSSCMSRRNQCIDPVASKPTSAGLGRAE